METLANRTARYLVDVSTTIETLHCGLAIPCPNGSPLVSEFSSKPCNSLAYQNRRAGYNEKPLSGHGCG
jgi:hypothetical protein